MCNSVFYSNREYRSPAQLVELLGGYDNLVWVDDPSKHDMNGCLCSIDLETSLRRADFEWKRGVDPMEWFVSKVN